MKQTSRGFKRYNNKRNGFLLFFYTLSFIRTIILTVCFCFMSQSLCPELRKAGSSKFGSTVQNVPCIPIIHH